MITYSFDLTDGQDQVLSLFAKWEGLDNKAFLLKLLLNALQPLIQNVKDINRRDLVERYESLSPENKLAIDNILHSK